MGKTLRCAGMLYVKGIILRYEYTTKQNNQDLFVLEMRVCPIPSGTISEYSYINSSVVTLKFHTALRHYNF
jgi:hypothetical protein